MSGNPPSYHIPDKTYFLPLATLDLSIGLFRTFQHSGISTVGQLLELDLEDFEHLNLTERSIQEVVRQMQALDLLEPASQGCTEALPTADDVDEMHCTGRRDNRWRPGRGKLRGAVPSAHIAQESHVCYKVRFALLPDVLRTALPRFAHYCYVHPFMLNTAGELVEWRPGQEATAAGSYPDHFRVATTPAELTAASIFKVEKAGGASCTLQSPGSETSLDLIDDTELRLRTLAEALTNPALPAFQIRVAPANFLTDEMRAMIAPAVSFPGECTVSANASHKRVPLKQGNHVAIPQRVAEMRIESLALSAQTHSCLRQAGIATVGAFLELEEERPGSILDRESLCEIYTAACAKGVLPTPSGILPAEQPEARIDPAPVFEEFYYYTTGTTSVVRQIGQPDELLYLVRAALFVDRLDGSRSGPVETLWLNSSHVEQSLIWQPEMVHLDTAELRMQTTNHAVASGAVFPQVNRPEDISAERRLQMLEMEEQYNLVPLRSESNGEAPLELFISQGDLNAAAAAEEHPSPPAIVIRVLEYYLDHPHAQPAGYRLEVNALEDVHYWLSEDHKQRRQLNAEWKRHFPGQPHPAGPSIVMHAEYATHTYKERNERTGRTEVKEFSELVGYRLVIGVLARTRVPSELIVEPRLTKPTFAAPERPIQPGRTPNYVPIQQAA